MVHTSQNHKVQSVRVKFFVVQKSIELILIVAFTVNTHYALTKDVIPTGLRHVNYENLYLKEQLAQNCVNVIQIIILRKHIVN